MKASVLTRMGERFRRIAVLGLALGLVGCAYLAFAPSNGQAKDDQQKSIAVREGQKLYEASCITCHGMNAQGVKDRGPSLIGVGPAAVEFQVSTGRMPAAGQDAQEARKPAQFDNTQTSQLAAYINSLGGGPSIPSGNLRGDISKGGELFRVNCASCHGFSSNGGALSSGKYAPSLKDATDRQIYAAMLTGPENMPVFGDTELTPTEKKAVVAYVQNMKSDQDQGGLGIGRTGPVPEGLVVFLVGIAVLLFATLWIAGKS